MTDPLALGQGGLEEAYLAIARPEIERFMHEALAAGMSGSPSQVDVLAAWNAALERMEAQGAPLHVVQAYRDSSLYAEVFAALTLAAATAAALALTGDSLREYLSYALGLSEDGEGGTQGPDGRYAWDANTRMISATLATGDYGDSMLAQLHAEGYTHKRWSTRYDSRVRDAHAEADRQTVELDQPFIVGGVALRYPGDPMAADFSQIANCRCELIGVNFGDRPWDYPEGEEPWNAPPPWLAQ